MHLKEAQVKSLVLMLLDHFRELSWSSTPIRRSTSWSAICRPPGLDSIPTGDLARQELESWGAGIRLLDEWATLTTRRRAWTRSAG